MNKTADRKHCILVVAGESSGEAHAAGLIKELRGQYTAGGLDFFGSGGEQMEAEGVDVVLDVSELAAIGPWAALSNLGNYLWLYRELVRQAKVRNPTLAILVDFPDFNLLLARKLRSMGIPICYFISPQVWAWRSSRVKQIRRYVNLMLVILPFEEEFYRRHGIAAHYVGNPSATRLRAPRPGRESDEGHRKRPIVALLPGSRKKEVEQILPVVLDAAKYVANRHPARFLLVRAPAIGKSEIEMTYQNWSKKRQMSIDLEFCEGNRFEALQRADCAIVKSGTSTLETMLAAVPFAMVYRISFLSWFSLRPFVRTNTYCLANLIAGQQIVPEFVQNDATGERIGAYILTLLKNPESRTNATNLLTQARKRLGSLNAYREGARRIITSFLIQGVDKS